MEQLSIQHRDYDGWKGIVLAGEIDLTTIKCLQEALSQVEQTQPLVLDMLGVTYIDSGGLKSLLREHHHRPAGLLIILPPRLRRVFELMHMETILKVFDSREELIAAIRHSLPPPQP